MKYIVIIIISLFTSFNVYADKCDSKTKSDLLKEANQIKVDYEEKTESVHVKDEMYDYTTDVTTLLVSIYNLTDNFSLEISNDVNDNISFANKKDYSSGKYTFDDIDYYKIINYKIKVYSNTSCDRYLIKTINYKKPMFNQNTYYSVCDGNENVIYCQKYITNPKIVKSMGVGLKEDIDNYNKGNISSDIEEPQESFFKKYYIYILIGGGVLIIIGTATWLFIKKKRSEI